MNSSGLSRKDTTKGPPLRILSLDGGGVRGYSMLIIIQELMHKTYVEIEGKAPKRDQIPKPCDHFDLIMGTGTGGLIAIMLGRLRLDLETCKEVYVRMTRKVFETDKTIAGIPYRSTLFKASKLEEAIKECVREHTRYESEGKDSSDGVESAIPISPISPGPRRHASNASVASFSARSTHSYQPYYGKGGNSNALLYDTRENRTKTAVTAMYKGTQKGGAPAILRSYDSRGEPAPEFDVTIWQAGRATSATGLAFKPIQIGQSQFIDEGPGQFNPICYALDEACINEWPGREVGVVVSIGTGKRPAGSDNNKQLWYEGFMGDFAEARRRLISKIEGCETTHQFAKSDYLLERGVNIENYYRLNVEIGVGEFGMNEWNRLADISTSTRKYLGKSEVQRMNVEAAAKLGKIYRAKMRANGELRPIGMGGGNSVFKDLPNVPEAHAMAVELPAEVPPPSHGYSSPGSRASYESGHRDTLEVPGTKSASSPRISPRSSSENHSPSSPLRGPSPKPPLPERSNDRLLVHNPTPAQYLTSGAGNDKISIVAQDDMSRSSSEWERDPQPQQHTRPLQPGRVEPPPLPPKTPLSEHQSQEYGARARAGSKPPLPYPADDGPPPIVNMARKPKPM